MKKVNFKLFMNLKLVTIATETNCNRRWFEVSTVVVKFKTVVFRLSLRFVSEAVTMDVS